MKRQRWKSFAFLLAACLIAVLLSGCMAFDVVMELKEDGSGRLVYDVLWKTEYAAQAGGEIPEGTTKVDTITIEGQEYTGYRVSRKFSSTDELKAILLEKSGDGEFTIDEETGIRSMSAFQLGNFIDSVTFVRDDINKTVDMRIVFSAMDVAAMVAQEGQDLDNSDLFKLYFNIQMPGSITNAVCTAAEITTSEGNARFSFTPDKARTTELSISSDYSGNIYVYSDRPIPKESYTFTGDAEANRKQDEETRAQIANDPLNDPQKNDPDGPSGVLMYIAVAGVFVVAAGLFLVWRIKAASRDNSEDKAYKRKQQRDEHLRNDYQSRTSKPLKKGGTKNNKR